MARTVVHTTSFDLVLRKATISVVSTGYRLVLECHEIESRDGNPVSSSLCTHTVPVTPELAAEIDKALEIARTEHDA